jgi:hypothetical protein
LAWIHASWRPGTQLDATAMLRAAQALSGELVLGSLIGRVLRLPG